MRRRQRFRLKRGAQARKSADIAMRAATGIQAEYRRKKAVREMQAKTKQNIIDAQKHCKLGKVRRELLIWSARTRCDRMREFRVKVVYC